MREMKKGWGNSVRRTKCVVRAFEAHKDSGAKRPYTPAAPNNAPESPTRSAGVIPEGIEGSTPPLKETKEVAAESDPSVNDPPRPPPVKLAPLG